MEQKYVNCQVENKIVDAEQGIVESIVSGYGVEDMDGDIIEFGAFAESINEHKVRVLAGHDWNMPVGKPIELKELAPYDERLPESLKDTGGIYAKTKFNLKTQRGNDAFQDIAEGIMDEWSVGFTIAKDGWDVRDGVRHITKGRLWEYSTVLFGANPHTATLAAKSLNDHIDRVSLSNAENAALIKRLIEREEFRAKEGRTLSSANVQRLKNLLESLTNAAQDISDLIESASKQDDTDKAAEQLDRDAQALMLKIKLLQGN